RSPAVRERTRAAIPRAFFHVSFMPFLTYPGPAGGGMAFRGRILPALASRPGSPTRCGGSMTARSLDPEIAAFYTAQSAFSDPGVFAPRYAGLPAEPVRLAEAARGLMIHRLEGPVFGYEIPQDRLHRDAETRYVDEILRIILDRDDAPLHRPRAIADRFVGVCRDFALLLCSFLRHFGVPARLRIGFADYLGPAGFHYDHVVTEYWDAERGWRLADAQLLDPRVAAAHGIDFDPMDVPRDRFLVSGVAWRLARAGEAAPDTFGLPDVWPG